MVYDRSKKRGVRRRYLPEPNPRKVTMQRDSTFVDVCRKAIELFFSDHNLDEADIMLADSGGFQIDVPEGWRLGSYYQDNNIVPSRYKMYTMIDEFKVCAFIILSNIIISYCQYQRWNNQAIQSVPMQCIYMTCN